MMLSLPQTHHDSTLAHRDHLHLHSMPKVARSLLKRQYKEDKDIFSVRDALQNFLQIAIRRMGLPVNYNLYPHVPFVFVLTRCPL